MIPICHVQVLPILSGVQRVMLDIFRHLDRSRYAPHVICQQPGPLSEELARHDIPCHFLPSLVRPIELRQDLAAYRGLCHLFREHAFQIVHTHSSKPGVLGRIAARRSGVPRVVHHVQGFAFHEFSSWRAKWLYKRIEAFAGEFCDRVIFVNVEEREMAVREGILPASKCVTIYNGVDLSRAGTSAQASGRNQWREQNGVAEDEVVVLMIGRLDAQKQPWIVPDIAERLECIGTRHNWRIHIAGSGEYDRMLSERIAERGVGSRVRPLGWQTDINAMMEAADIVLHPSLWEGLPVCLLEAQAWRLPVVASDVKGNREVVTAPTGRLCSPKDAASYAMHLAELIDQPLLRAKLGRAARVQAELRFSASQNMKLVGALYDELLGLSEAQAEQKVRAA